MLSALIAILEVPMADKIVQVDVDLLKERVSNKARAVLESAKDKVQDASQRLNEKAIEAKDHALIGTIDKGISLLQKAKKKLS